MTSQALQVRQILSRSRVILTQFFAAELCRAIAYCRIGKDKGNAIESLPYFIVAERTSHKFIKLRARRRLLDVKPLLGLMARLEEELGGSHGWEQQVSDNIYP